MRFRKITFQRDGVIDHVLNKKLEYFHHYWSLVLHTEKRDKSILLDSTKFESHRSLLRKCKIEIESSGESNLPRAINNINKLYLNSLLFSKNNLVLKKRRDIHLGLNKIISEFQAKSIYYKEEALSKIEELENQILRYGNTNYAVFLAESLVQIFDKPKPLNDSDEEHIEFLVNALIVELFHVEYSMGFVRKVPDIILFMDYGFPKEVFVDKKISKNTDEIYMETMLQAFKVLLNSKPSKGYVIFKVDGIDFQLNEPVKIWGSEIYNPQTLTKFSKIDVEDWVYKSWLKSELFYADGEKSTCNILVPIKYHKAGSHFNEERDFYAAWEKAQDALTILNQARNSFDRFGKKHNGSIDIRNRILISSESYSIKSPHYPFNKTEVLKLKMSQLRLFEESIKYMNCLNPDDELHRKIINVNSLLKRYSNEPWEFKFNDLWIKAFESFIPNDIDGIQKLSYKCLVLRYDRHYLNYIKGFFHGALKSERNPIEKPYYSFSEEEQFKLEIRDIQEGNEVIAGDSFKDNFMNFSKNLDIRVLNNNLKMAQQQLEKNCHFINELWGWVKSLTDQVYAQRNLYAHSNSVDEFGEMKLKEDIIYLAKVVTAELQLKIYKGFKDPIKEIEAEFEQIKNTYKRIN